MVAKDHHLRGNYSNFKNNPTWLFWLNCLKHFTFQRTSATNTLQKRGVISSFLPSVPAWAWAFTSFLPNCFNRSTRMKLPWPPKGALGDSPLTNKSSGRLFIINRCTGRRELTRTRGRWTPRLAVSPARCTGSSAAAGSARSSGRSARCTRAASPAGWGAPPASPSGCPPRRHLRRRATGGRPRRGWSSSRTPHPARPRLCVPGMSSSRARSRPRLRRGSGAWQHQSRPARGGLHEHACVFWGVRGWRGVQSCPGWGERTLSARASNSH